MGDYLIGRGVGGLDPFIDAKANVTPPDISLIHGCVANIAPGCANVVAGRRPVDLKFPCIRASGQGLRLRRLKPPVGSNPQ